MPCSPGLRPVRNDDHAVGVNAGIVERSGPNVPSRARREIVGSLPSPTSRWTRSQSAPSKASARTRLNDRAPRGRAGRAARWDRRSGSAPRGGSARRSVRRNSGSRASLSIACATASTSWRSTSSPPWPVWIHSSIEGARPAMTGRPLAIDSRSEAGEESTSASETAMSAEACTAGSSETWTSRTSMYGSISSSFASRSNSSRVQPPPAVEKSRSCGISACAFANALSRMSRFEYGRKLRSERQTTASSGQPRSRQRERSACSGE